MYPILQDLKDIISNCSGNTFILCDEINGDMETPIGLFQKLCKREKGYLLESNDGVGKVARYSFIGYDIEDFTIENTISNPLDTLKSQLQKIKPVNNIENVPFSGGYVGYFAYDVVRKHERLPELTEDDLKVPIAKMACARKLIIYDHVELKIKIIVKHYITDNIEKDYEEAVSEVNKIKKKILNSIPQYEDDDKLDKDEKVVVKSNTTRNEYIANVEKAKEYIREGDIFQVVLSQRLSVKCKKDPFSVYRKLRVVNPSPYMYYINFADFQIVGSSPETLVKVIDGTAYTMPIAGTRQRGRNKEEDEKLERELLEDEKELAEHLMLVDLGRNDLGKVCEFGTVKINNMMHIEKFSHVMHIVTNVEGKMSKNKNVLEALKICLPAGTVSGAPKVRAMEIIEELEKNRRGVYAGAIGYFSYEGNMDTCIAIRTMVFKDGVAYLQGGAGIVYDSVPENEYEETLNKLKALTTTLGIKIGDEIDDFDDR